jgi:hypothetical protein
VNGPVASSKFTIVAEAAAGDMGFILAAFLDSMISYYPAASWPSPGCYSLKSISGRFVDEGLMLSAFTLALL